MAQLAALSALRTRLAALQERCRQRRHFLGSVPVVVAEDRGACPLCDGPMLVQKTVPRNGLTLAHGTFGAHETIHVCAGRCHWPSGSLVTRRAVCLSEALLPMSNAGYDLMTLVGRQRFLHRMQREEIQETLRDEHSIAISTGEVSDLARRFALYLARLHRARAPLLAAALAADGGWPLHVDATGEAGRGTLLIVMAGWRQWVLGSWKISTERADLILPCLRTVLSRFGAPCAAMRDLGKAVTPALDTLRLAGAIAEAFVDGIVGEDTVFPVQARRTVGDPATSVRQSARGRALVERTRVRRFASIAP